jgi:phosphomannomutase/phosphoglucomutase
VIDIDGARVLFQGGWGLVRASNTQPVLVLRFEAVSPERLDDIRSTVEEALEKIKAESVK